MSARTLCVDVGGTNLKAEIVDVEGQAHSEPLRVPTPRPAVPEALLEAIASLAEGREFDRVSIGFPGVVRGGVTRTAPNLDDGWHGYPLAATLEARLGRPVRVCNDADLAGFAVIEGRDVEMVLTLGTGMGAGLYVDGRLVPNLELGHHPFGDGRTYEERVSDRELAAIGVAAWKPRVLETVAQIRPVWNFRRLYLGGGNARFFEQRELPADVVLCDNRAGVLGGVRLWEPARG
ncbi:MAG: ROK family protein [Deltaproteobacteria bacterium]|nr:ROK family protein [Deltaproteobacteria bacterium]